MSASATLTAGLPALITAEQFRDQLLNVSTAKFDRMKALGELPQHVEFGRAHRWKRDEAQAWLEAGCPKRNEWEQMKLQQQRKK